MPVNSKCFRDCLGKFLAGNIVAMVMGALMGASVGGYIGGGWGALIGAIVGVLGFGILVWSVTLYGCYRHCKT